MGAGGGAAPSVVAGAAPTGLLALPYNPGTPPPLHTPVPAAAADAAGDEGGMTDAAEAGRSAGSGLPGGQSL